MARRLIFWKYHSRTMTSKHDASHSKPMSYPVPPAEPTVAPHRPKGRRHLTLDDYVDGVLSGNRSLLGRAITLLESLKPEHQQLAQELLVRLLPHTGKSQRVGISGVPGAGKSTFIETLGTNLTEDGHKVAVLAVDPSSSITGGSILGDKTRMVNLAANPRAFIRPSPSAGTLGGVARKTRETMLICEAAGFDVVIIETVGVGQSETVVSDMVDFFLVLMISGAGDELQGIKRGILEIADMLAINKADGDNEERARRARHEYEIALHLMRTGNPLWHPPVVCCSSLKNTGVRELWAKIEEHHTKMNDAGECQRRRQQQMVKWMWSLIEEQLIANLRRDPEVVKLLNQVQSEVLASTLTPAMAAHRVLSTFGLQLES
jgi:LAO/AO transport system kinase